MDAKMLVGLMMIVVVGFFAWQWWSRSQRKSGMVGGRKPVSAAGVAGASVATGVPSPSAEGPAPNAASMSTAPPKEEALPQVAGQSEADLRAKEPLQQRVPASQQQPVTYEGEGPANFDGNMRHPEQLFHQPMGPAPSLQVSDVPSGRAAAGSTPLAVHQQPFSPEMAQNGGALIGNSVFAYDGMEPTEFSSF